MRLFLFTLLIFICQNLSAQFWFGPKFGFQRTSFKYHNEFQDFPLFNNSDLVQKDIYDKVKANYNWQTGAVMTYTASVKYAVHTELFYERIVKRVTSEAFEINNRSTYNFVRVPLLLRVTQGREPVYYYVNGGPQVGYWISGKVRSNESVKQQGDSEFTNYKIVFDRDKAGDNEIGLDKAQRLQWGLLLGGGALFDLRTGGRLQLDLRYNWGHSNMGSNKNSNLLVEIAENIEQSNQRISVSLAYLWGYNPADARKGSSTNDLTNKGKRNRKSKKKANG